MEGAGKAFDGGLGEGGSMGAMEESVRLNSFSCFLFYLTFEYPT